MTKGEFNKKVFEKLESSPLGENISPSQEKGKTPKKIIATKAVANLREEFKKTFLPLLIDVFELRQLIENYKMKQEGDPFIGKISKSPKEILEQLEAMQETIEESVRWSTGVILQISKGIDEAKEALEFIKEEEEQPAKKKLWSLLKEKLHL
ncbi:MAG: hypothetical protein SP1CHLAM54_01990 [Chlamydiia bacterium]|nr:hypothetical protein [Chlamydiia bacterium]MCH9615117.1 hypothetical protein [Chlamydiia bacterium]MCH9628561.1 hypothetical protein [Chlamydiia bacterium]